MHTRFPLWRPFQTDAKPSDANEISPSLEIFSESIQERGRIVSEPQTLRRMRTLFLRRSRSIFGASKAYTRVQWGVLITIKSAYLIEDIDEGQSMVALERHRGIHALLRREHPGKIVWEFPGSDVERHQLREEGILGC